MTHITIKDERVAAIVSESALAMSQLLGALLTSEMAASALPAVLPAAFPWASSLPEDHLKAFAGELREAVVAGSPERVERVLVDWRAVAEVRAGALHLSGRAAPSGSVTAPKAPAAWPAPLRGPGGSGLHQVVKPTGRACGP